MHCETNTLHVEYKIEASLMQYTEDVDMEWESDMAHGQPSFRAVFHMSHMIIVAIFKCAKLEGKLVRGTGTSQILGSC